MPDGSILPPGLFPRYLSRPQAAAYLGVSPRVFDEEVDSGRWPAADRRGAKGGALTWDRLLLDRRADERAGLVQMAPPDAPLAIAAEQEAMRRATENQHRDQHRPPQRR